MNKNKRTMAVVLSVVFGMALMFSGCENLANPGLGVGGIKVSGVVLDASTASINIGATKQLAATIAPADATNKNITWKTSNASIATVANGLVSALAAGEATITATTEDGLKTASCVVTSTTITVRGTITLPSAVSNAPWAVSIDTDINGGNGQVKMAQGIANGTSISYSIPDVPAGTYYIHSGVYTVSGRVGSSVEGDLGSVFGGTATELPTAPNCTISPTGSNVFDLTARPMTVAKGTVTGRVTLPASVAGKKWYVHVDNNTDGGDGIIVNQTGTVTGNYFDYTLSNVPAGTYYLVTVVDMDDSWGTSASGPVSAGDYWIYHDGTASAPPAAPSFTVTANGSVTQNLTAVMYGTSSGYSISGTLTIPAGVDFDSNTAVAIYVQVLAEGNYVVTKKLQTDLAYTGALKTYDYTITGVPAGSYYLGAYISKSGNFTGSEDNIAGVRTSTRSIVVTDANLTGKNQTLEIVFDEDGGTIAGTVTLTPSIIPAGTKWLVYLVSAATSTNLRQVPGTMAAEGTTFTYTVPKVPVGTYTVGVIVDANNSWGSASSGAPDSGDYYGTAASQTVTSLGTTTVNLSPSLIP